MVLAFTIPATIGLVAIAFVASSKGYQVIAALLAAAVWLLVAADYFIWASS